jgi:hypothetical protein
VRRCVQHPAAPRRSAHLQRKWIDLFAQLVLPDFAIVGGTAITRPLVELFGRSGLAEHAPLFGNLTISNVRGPDTVLYVAGARLVSRYPCSIPFHALALNITAQSYADRLDIGLVACRRAVPDLAQLADRLAVAFAELERAVDQRSSRARSDDPRSATDQSISQAAKSGSNVAPHRPRVTN